MTGYTKLFGSILDSTVWRESKETRLVWITMLAMADRDGVVNTSIPGLADRAKVTLEECQLAIKVFSSPDEWSRSKEHEGRRIEEVDGGWRLLNHAKYRALMSAESVRAKAAERQAKHRARKSSVSATYKGREKRFEKAFSDGDASTCDNIASEGLTQ